MRVLPGVRRCGLAGSPWPILGRLRLWKLSPGRCAALQAEAQIVIAEGGLGRRSSGRRVRRQRPVRGRNPPTPWAASPVWPPLNLNVLQRSSGCSDAIRTPAGPSFSPTRSRSVGPISFMRCSARACPSARMHRGRSSSRRGRDAARRQPPPAPFGQRKPKPDNPIAARRFLPRLQHLQRRLPHRQRHIRPGGHARAPSALSFLPSRYWRRGAQDDAGRHVLEGVFRFIRQLRHAGGGPVHHKSRGPLRGRFCRRHR